jgi:hypothetical protein
MKHRAAHLFDTNLAKSCRLVFTIIRRVKISKKNVAKNHVKRCTGRVERKKSQHHHILVRAKVGRF